MKNPLLLLAFVCAVLGTRAQNTAQIGTGTQVPGSTLYAPIYMYSPTSAFPYSRSNILYEASELAAANIVPGSQITSIAFYKAGTGATNGNNLDVKVYMANSTTTAPLGSTNWTSIMSTHSQVFAQNGFQVSSSSGWVTIVLDNPFIYTGGSLEIAFENVFHGPSPYSTDNFDWQYTSGFSGYVIGDMDGSAFPPTLGSHSTYSERPNIQIGFISTTGDCANYFSGFSIDSISGDAFKVDWVPGSGNTSFYLEYGPQGFAPGSGTMITGTYPSTSQPPVVVTGLQPETNYDVYFGEICNSGADSAYFPSAQSVTTTKLCASPTDFTAVDTTATSVDLSWNQAGSVQEYWVIYGSEGFDPTTGGDIDTSTSTIYTLSGLDPTTSYDIYLATNCAGGNGVSDTIGPINVVTPLEGPTGVICPGNNPVTIFTEGFEGAQGALWTGDIGSGSSNGMWNINSGSTNSSTTGPDGAQSGSSYAYFEAGGAGPASLISPAIDLTSATDGAELAFWMHAYGSDIGSLMVRVSTTSNTGAFSDTVFYYDQGQLQTSYEDPWQQVGARLDQYVGQTIWLEIVADRNGSYRGDIGIDFLTVQTCGDTCVAPSALFTTNLTEDSVDIGWIENSSATNWDIEFGATGFTPTGTPTYTGVTSKPYRIRNLSPNTTYDVYVRSDCGGTTGQSSWAGPFTFTTPLAGPQGVTCSSGNSVMIMTEEFDEQGGWTGDIGTFNGQWQFEDGSTTTSNTGPSGPHSGGNYIYFESSGSGPASLVSPAINLMPATSGAELAFWIHAYGEDVGYLVVRASNVSANGPFNDTVFLYNSGSLQSSESDVWQQTGVSLNNYLGQRIWLEFEADQNGTAGDIALDLLTIETCGDFCLPEIYSLDSLFVEANDAEVFVDGSSDNFQMEWGPCGYTQGTGTFMTGTSPFDLSGLTPRSCYSVYVRRNCGGASGFSGWAGPFSFITECGPFMAPYFNDFENDVLDLPPDCWEFYETYSSAWVEVEDLTGTGAPYSGSQALYLYNSFADDSDDTLYAITPQFSDLTGGDKQINFFANSSDDNVDLIVGTTSDPTGLAAFNPVDTISFADENQYEQVVVKFTAANGYNGTDEYIVLAHGLGATYDYVRIDDFSYEVIPSCEPPLISSLGVSITTNNSAAVYWGSGSAGDKTYINWGLPGYTPGLTYGLGVDSVTGAMDAYTIGGLAAQTAYEFYVMDSCAADTLSPWVGPFTFNTDCDPFVAPFTETFETSSASRDCWNNEFISGTQPWAIGSGSSGGSVTSAHGGSANAEFTYSSSGIYTTRYVSPGIDITALTVPFLRFYYAQEEYFSDHSTLTVYVRDINSTNWTQVFYDGDARDAWTLAEVVLPAGADTIVLAFEGFQDTYGRSLVFDDVEVVEGPACPDLSGLNITGLTDVSVTLDWVGNANAMGYEVWFGPQGFYQGESSTGGTKIVVSGEDLYIDTLNPQTCYEFAVRSVCSATDTSDWIMESVSFCTPCSGVNAPYAQNFDGTTAPAIDPCWTVINQTSSIYSSVETYGGSFPVASSAPNSVEFYNSDATSGDMILVSPYLTDFDQNKVVSLDVLDESSNAADLVIGTLSDPSDPSTFTPYTTILETGLAEDVWQEVRVLFSNYTGTDKYVGIKMGINATYDYLFVDNFVYEHVTCPYPSALDTSAITTTSVDLDWITGGSSYWQIEYGPAGFEQGSGIVVNALTNPYTLSGLSPGTLYDVYVRDSCGTGDVSLWTGPMSVYTKCSPVTGGTYTIGAGGDYTSFREVSDALNICGITGPVVFNIQPGHYEDHLHLMGIEGVYSGVPGVSATNTITFNGSGNDTLLWDQVGPQAAVLLDGTGHVTFNNMYITNPLPDEAWGILLTNNSDSVAINGSTIVMDSTATSDDRSGIIISNNYDDDRGEDAFVDHITVTNSTILGGYDAISLEGNGTNDFGLYHVITDNVIRGFSNGGIYADDLQDIVVTGNTLVAVSGATADGIYLSDVNDYRVERNYIRVQDYGLYVFDGNDGFTPASNSTVINNMIISSGDYGAYLSDAVKTDVYHNTMFGEPGMAINDDEDLDIQNNIFVSSGDFAFESFDALDASTNIDYNLYHKTGSGNMFDIGTSSFSDLAAWQTDNASINANSISGDPLFVSADDLHLIGGLANDVGNNAVGVTVDIDGDVRPASGSSTVDIGADEYTPVAGDLALIDAGFVKGLCLSATDSVMLAVQNVVGLTVDFSNDPLTAAFNVTGPVNTSGTVTLNTGTLAPQDTAYLYGENVDLSIPGTYVLDVYIDPNGINNLTMNDTILSVEFEVEANLEASPDTYTITSATDSVELCVESSFFEGGGEFFFTEVSHYSTSTSGLPGEPAGGVPSWMVADDYVEITGVPGSDLEGYTLEQWTTSSLQVSYTFPSNTVLSPDGTAIIVTGQLRGSTPSPSDYYYHGNGGFTGSWGSTSGGGRILKDPQGNIVDAVVYDNTYSFPAAAGVSAADWSGNVPNSDFTWGIRLEGPDMNSAAGWVASATSPQNPNMVNNGVTVPQADAPSGFTWTLDGTVVDSATCIFAGPFTAMGTYNYVATYSNACGSFTDTVEIIVEGCFVPQDFIGSAVSLTSVALSWDTIALGSADFEIEYGPVGFVPGTGTMMNISADNKDTISGLTQNLCTDVYIRSVCDPSNNSSWVGPVTVCPEEVPCDDMEVYAPGLVNGQSALFLEWEGEGGDGEFSTARSVSGSSSLHIYEGTEGFADIVAYFDTLSAGAWQIDFDMFVEPNSGAYFNIQQNHDTTGADNQWGAHVYFRDDDTAVVSFADSTAGGFGYTTGQWVTMTTVIDLDNDTIWIEHNGATTGIGWQYSLANAGEETQFNGVNFYTGVLDGNNYPIDFYVDDFCVTAYTYSAACTAPSNVVTQNESCEGAEVSWISTNGGFSIVEYGPAGFTPGTGTTMMSQSPVVLNGLMAGTAYDIYLADTCVGDTSMWVGPVAFSTTSGLAPTNLVVQNESCNSAEVSWTSGNGGFSIVEYGPAGFIPGTGTMMMSQSPVVLSGLTAGTAYDVYAADTCGGDTTAWSGVVGFTTTSGAAPTNLLIQNEGCDSAEVSWTSTNNGFSIIEYGPAGFAPGTGTTVMSQSPFGVNGLAPGTAYDVYAADTCGGDTTASTGPESFTTLSGPISAGFTFTLGSPTSTDLTVTFDAATSQGADTYAWDFGDGGTDNGVAPQHTYTGNGTYYVELAVTGACGTDTITDTLEIEGISLPEDVLGSSLSVYPNPTQGIINVEFDAPEASDAKLRLLDLRGKEIKNLEYDDVNGHFNESISLHGLAKGVYIIEISSDDMRAFRRVTLE